LFSAFCYPLIQGLTLDPALGVISSPLFDEDALQLTTMDKGRCMPCTDQTSRFSRYNPLGVVAMLSTHESLPILGYKVLKGIVKEPKLVTGKSAR